MRTIELAERWEHIAADLRDTPNGYSIAAATIFEHCASELKNHIEEQTARHDPSLSMTDLDRVADYGIQAEWDL